MHHDQATYRDLCEAIWAYRSNALHSDLLVPWLASADAERDWLAHLGSDIGDTPRSLPDEDRWRLYALTRLLDLIRLHVDGPRYQSFAEGLGLAASEPESFHPFWHEIATVEPAGIPAPELAETIWPAVTLGPLLITRATARIRANPETIDPTTAATSTLYWAWVRDGRRCEDLSTGWGGNSQWRTPHRLDYATVDAFHFNHGADGRTNDDLSRADTLELLRHRCFLTPRANDRGLFPYDLTHVERR